MARRIRLDGPALAHHVMIRGLEGRALFLDPDDRHDFVDRIARIFPGCGARCFAWSLMSNHVHLVVQTDGGALSRVMRRLNTGYALRFNRCHERRGYVFMDRFRSRVVESEADLMGLIRYVHRNPIEGGIVGSLAALAGFPWSGHAALVGARASQSFEAADEALALFDEDPRRARARLLRWMEGVDDATLPTAAPAVPARTGPTGSRAPAGGLAGLLHAASEHYALLPGDLASGAKSRRIARARAAAAYIAVVEMGVPGGAVARALGVGRAAVSAALERGKRVGREDGFAYEGSRKHPGGETEI